MKTFLAIAVFCLSQLVASQNECPQGGTRWLDEKCYSLYVSYQSYEAAQQVCATRGGHLAIIKGEAQQTFLDNFIHNVSGIEEEVWLGATRVNKTNFQWEDGTPLGYANWVPDSPSEVDGRDCVVMQSRISKLEEAEGRWRDVSCNRPNLFVCENEPVWGPKEVVMVLVETRRKLDNLAQELETLVERYENLVGEHGSLVDKNKNLDATLQTLMDNPVPIGFLYYEHHGQPSPQALWPYVQWLDISYSYSGLFFRAVGGGSAGFGSVQRANSPSLTHVRRSDNQSPRSGDITITPGEWSPWLDLGAAVGGSYFNVMKFYVTDGDVRPENAAIRIWRRIG